MGIIFFSVSLIKVSFVMYFIRDSCSRTKKWTYLMGEIMRDILSLRIEQSWHNMHLRETTIIVTIHETYRTEKRKGNATLCH